MFKKDLFLKVIISIAILVFAGAVPKVLNYQGKLIDSSGVGVEGIRDITFRLYASETAPEENYLWEKTIAGVVISRGLFSVELTDFPDSVDFSSPYWLEIQVGSEILTPREKLASAPYSIHSLRSDYTTNALQSIYTDSLSTRRSGNVLFRTGPGATLSDRGDSIIIKIERETGISTSDFKLDVLQSSLSVYRGRSITNKITVVSLTPGRTSSVTLTTGNLPEGVTASFSPASCSPTCPATITLNTTDSTPPGTYNITIIGSSDDVVHTANFTLTVNIPFDYTLIVDPSSRTIDQGSQTSTVVTANLLTGFPENVSFSVSGLPSGCLATFSPTSCILSCSATLTINTSATTPPGSYDCQITAMTTSGVVRTITFTLIVRYFAFTLTLSPSSGYILPTGGPITSTIGATLGSPVSQSVSFSHGTLPDGISININPSSCNPTCNSTMSITSSGATIGTYPIDITGTAIGGATQTQTYTLTVCDPPSAPQNLTATREGGSIILNWQAPVSDGGCAITNYKIYRGTSPNPSNLLVTVGNVLTYTDNNVSSGTAYYYRIKAVNAVGDGAGSEERCAGWQTFSYTGSQQTFTVPTGVTSITVKAWGGGGGGGGQSSSAPGGGGAYASSVITTTPGEALTVIVGGGGGNGANGCVTNTGGGSGGIGGGGIGNGGNGGNAGPTGCSSGGGGGGAGSFVLRGSNVLLAAGGGGGGGGAEPGAGTAGYGGGGGVNGGSGSRGSCTATGGIAGASGSTNGTNGAQRSDDGSGGGGGGGGYNGGTGGGAPNCDGPGGGGGGGNSLGTTVMNGSGTTPGNASDPDRGSAGNGGGPGTPGNAGKLIIIW